MRRAVVFPQPLAPRRLTNSPEASSRLKSFNAGRPAVGYFMVRLLMVNKVPFAFRICRRARGSVSSPTLGSL